MTKSSILVGMAAATLLALSSVNAEMDTKTMEKCKVVKEGKEFWVMLTPEMCKQANSGDYSNLPSDVQEKLGVAITPAN
ncbi:MAG: hypothetical protein EOP33_02040 [Rickettsiaceae bacterium]|nr:MAG: hypothetical protein EOP33_02040 [Rickettsiaceae bacterium]